MHGDEPALPRKNNSCRATFVVELMEPFLSRWFFLELLHVSEIVGRENLWVTNVKRSCEKRILGRIAGFVSEKSIIDLEDALPHSDKIIVLDPSAEQPLCSSDFQEGETIVIVGGIMGSHPPIGRTKKELTLKMKKAEARNLGRYQLTLNGAVYVARKVCEGVPLSAMRFAKGLSLTTRYGSVELPYAFPLDEDGGLVVARGELDYVIAELEEDESAMLRRRRRDICAEVGFDLLDGD